MINLAAEDLHKQATPEKASRLDVLKRLRAQVRPRAQSYRTIDGLSAERDAVPWYWRLVAIGSSVLLLGGYVELLDRRTLREVVANIAGSFLILPATFDISPDLRVSSAGIGIFGIALLTAGFSLTALSCFAVKNPLFQADSVFLPSLYSCAIGLLTIFYNLLVFSRYVWRTPTTLLTIAGAISTIVYGGLLIWTQRKIQAMKAGRLSLGMVPLASNAAAAGNNRDNENVWQDPAYYDNYVRNMYPASVHTSPGPVRSHGATPASAMAPSTLR